MSSGMLINWPPLAVLRANDLDTTIMLENTNDIQQLMPTLVVLDEFT
jgi:hypothetical protein